MRGKNVPMHIRKLPEEILPQSLIAKIANAVIPYENVLHRTYYSAFLLLLVIRLCLFFFLHLFHLVLLALGCGNRELVRRRKALA